MSIGERRGPTVILREKLLAGFAELGAGTVTTTGRYELPVDCAVQDMDWNHMDQAHRPFVHRTYTKALRLAIGRDFAISLTAMPFFKLPFLVLVADVRVGPGLFYQTFTVANLIFVIVIIEHLPTKLTVTWHIASHSWLRSLHPAIDRRLQTLNAVQNAEDMPIRARRSELRRQGYRFRSDDPDLLSANSSANGTIPPTLLESSRIELDALKMGELNRIQCSNLPLLVRPEAHGGATVWPSACPHEGGPLECGEVAGRSIRCPWHGLEFAGASLTPHRPRAILSGLQLALEGRALTIAPATTGGAEREASFTTAESS